MGQPRWEHFHHGADIGVRGVADTAAGAFEQAALALTAVIAEPANVACKSSLQIECEAPDLELLLVDWLNALIYEMATRNMLFAGFKVQLMDNRLVARVQGESVDVSKHHPAVEVKGATYTELRVEQAIDSDWLAQCVVDV